MCGGRTGLRDGAAPLPLRPTPQERATKVAHGGTARLAAAAGDTTLARIAGAIAGDEARHEAAYTRTMDEIFSRDPSGAVLAVADMLRKQIVMPAHLMDDGAHGGGAAGRCARAVHAAHAYLDAAASRAGQCSAVQCIMRAGAYLSLCLGSGLPALLLRISVIWCLTPGSHPPPSLLPARSLFSDFSEVAEGLGVYTAQDYCDIAEHLVARWRVAERTGLSHAAEEARDYVCGLPPRLRRLAERKAARKGAAAKADVRFAWLFGRSVAV